jgi:hypothetical protein
MSRDGVLVMLLLLFGLTIWAAVTALILRWALGAGTTQRIAGWFGHLQLELLCVLLLALTGLGVVFKFFPPHDALYMVIGPGVTWLLSRSVSAKKQDDKNSETLGSQNQVLNWQTRALQAGLKMGGFSPESFSDPAPTATKPGIAPDPVPENIAAAPPPVALVKLPPRRE